MVGKGSGPWAELHQLRPVTRDLIESVLMDASPGAAAIVDFGLDSQEHYEALYYPIRQGEITPTALDEALGHGEKLTALVRAAPSNPHKEVQFYTSWDHIFGRPGPEGKVGDQGRPGPDKGPGQEGEQEHGQDDHEISR